MAKQSITPTTAWVANSTNPYADQANKDGNRAAIPTLVPELTSPDYLLTETFEGTKNATVFNKDASTTWGMTDPTDAGNKVLSANYTVEGWNGVDGSNTEQELLLPIDAVQLIVKFREYTPASYTTTDAANHKSLAFWSGPYGVSSSYITINSECWPRAGGGTPSVNAGGNGDNWGHCLTSGDPLLWIDADTQWHDVCAVLELADGAGNFGRFRIYRDNILLIDTDSVNMAASEVSPLPPSNEVITFSTVGNYIDTVRLFGWCNNAVVNVTPYASEMHFLYDDLEITANSTFKTIVEPT